MTDETTSQHDLRSTRIKAGLERARANGIRLGRPGTVVDLRKLKARMNTGMSEHQAIKDLGIPLTSWYDFKHSHRDLVIAAGLKFRTIRIKSDPIRI